MSSTTLRRAPYDLGALDDAYAPLGCTCSEEALGDLLSGAAAGKGASIGASVGSFIPGVGTAVGGAVGAAAGAISDFVGTIGKETCKLDGQEVPCPCHVTDIECWKRWAKSRIEAPKHSPPATTQRAPLSHTPLLGRHLPKWQTPATPARRPAPPMPVGAHFDALAREPEQHSTSSAVPLALGAAALAAAGGGAWWWWKKRKNQ